MNQHETATDEPSRECVAYHEAGHAGASIRLGRRFRYVTIRPNDESLGHVKPWTMPPSFRPDIEVTPTGERLLRDRVMILLAGGLAAEKHCPGIDSGDSLMIDGFIVGGDIHHAVDYAMYVTGGDSDEAGLYVGWLRHRTSALLSSPSVWAGVGAIAAALLEHERLTLAQAGDAWRRGVHEYIERAQAQRGVTSPFGTSRD